MQKIQVPNLQILICLLYALMNQTTIYFSFLNQTIFSHLCLFGFHFCPAWRLVRWGVKANKMRRSKACVRRLNYKTQRRRKFLYTVQQSFESIEAKHMQNAWQPVKGYLQQKNMVVRSLTHINPFSSFALGKRFQICILQYGSPCLLIIPVIHHIL